MEVVQAGGEVAYTPCPDFPFHFGCMSDKIKEIQTCLGMQTNYQTGNFGPLTQQALKTAGYDASQITNQIYQTIKANCKGQTNTNIAKPPLVSAPAPPTTNTTPPPTNP